MNRYGVTITLDYETEADAEQVENDIYDILQKWPGTFCLDVEIGEPEYPAR